MTFQLSKKSWTNLACKSSINQTFINSIITKHGNFQTRIRAHCPYSKKMLNYITMCWELNKYGLSVFSNVVFNRFCCYCYVEWTSWWSIVTIESGTKYVSNLIVLFLLHGWRFILPRRRGRCRPIAEKRQSGCLRPGELHRFPHAATRRTRYFSFLFTSILSHARFNEIEMKWNC